MGILWVNSEVGPDAEQRGEARLFLAVAVCVLVLFAIGVWWLRQLPVVSSSQSRAPSVVHVDLIRPSQTPTVERRPTRDQMPSTDLVQKQPEVEAPNPVAGEDLVIPDLPTPVSPVHSSTVPPEPPSPTAMTQTAANGIAADFQRTLFEHIEHYRHYPDAARAQQLVGETQLLFAMSRDGAVLDIWVQRSSGYELLDEAAIDTIQRAQPLPLIPSLLPDRLNIMIHVAFAMP